MTTAGAARPAAVDVGGAARTRDGPAQGGAAVTDERTHVRRQSITVPGLVHGDQPIPTAVTITGAIGGLLVTGGISGLDPETGEIPKEVADEVAQAFANLRAVLDAAECSPEDVAKITVFTTDRSIREHVNREWVAMFPDPESRPARHTLTQQLAGMRLQLDCLAVLRSRA